MPFRHSLLKLHTGGVTSRTSEINLIFPEIDKSQILDFSTRSDNAPTQIIGSNRAKKIVLKTLVFFAFKLGLFNQCNTDKEYKKLMPWILTIRGHYAYRSITSSTLFYLWNRLTSNTTPGVDSSKLEDSLSIHYRLGDLLKLADKKPIEFSRIGLEIQRVIETHNPSRVLCFSDSPQVATELLQNFTLGKPFESKDIPASSVINAACKSKFFVGSNSKISFWIVCLRLFQFPTSQNSLPKGSEVNWIHCSDHELKYSNVEKY